MSKPNYLTRSLSTFVPLALASSQVLAGGFALSEQSASGMGTAFAGRSSSALDASTVFSNPAGMSYLGEQVSGGMALISASSDISNASSNLNGSNDGDMVPLTAIPFGYYVKPLDENWHFGIGVYAPFGLATEYENNYQGRAFADQSDFTVVSIQPTLSYKLNEQWSFGAGISANYAEGTLSSSVNPLPALFNDSEYKVTGNDWGYGYNLGVMFQAAESTRLGLSYKSKVDYRLEGDAKNTALTSQGGFVGIQPGKYAGSLDLTTPESLDFSVTHQFDSRWTGYAGSTWTRWSRFKEVVIESPNNASPLFTEVSEAENWHDTVSHAIGLSYQLTPLWVLRSGLAFDPTPTNNTDRSPRIPSGDRYVFAVGAGYSPTENLTLDLAYIYLQEEEISVDNSELGKGYYQADYTNSAHSVAAQATWRF
ncbi:MAG: Long-chain fatty acid transport protein [Pseudomonadales bacterium RIFCSPLOWO2_12_59_9]|nr:MAG: Long-chain fatty acid transport protein [Pseudomonadales bacterium RIFCSPLOWO2_12_59_9]